MDKVNCGKFSSIVIGSGTLPIRCSEILLDNNHEICAIVSSDTEVKKWAKKNQINLVTPGPNLVERLKQPFDYLFSIVNEDILQQDILQLPRKLAINYHDAPLPRYAGTHATSWALLNGETTHGISWHIIADKVDAGDILKQAHVEITEDDTALTLNTKCYEAAIRTFTELVQDLSTEKVAAQPQDLKKRTFFARYKRPADGCVISWDKPAAEIFNLFRALNFGKHPNPIGVAKFAVGNEFFTVSGLEILNEISQSAPGTINKIGSDFFRVCANDRQIILRGILSLKGEVVAARDLAAKFNLSEGHQLKSPDAETGRRIDEIYKTVCRHENYWLKKLLTLEPATVPYGQRSSTSPTARFANVRASLPSEVFNISKELQREKNINDYLLAAFGVLLARLNGTSTFDIAYANAELQSKIAGLENIFSAEVPMHFNVDMRQNLMQQIESGAEEVAAIKKHLTYVSDLRVRYPELNSAATSPDSFTLPVAFVSVKSFRDYRPSGENALILVVAENTKECRWFYDQNKIDSEKINRLVSHFTMLLKGASADPECPVAYLPLLSEQERNRLLIEWNRTAADYPKDKCIHQLFEEQVVKTPDAIALIAGEKRTTYQELDCQANQLAHYLLERGVRPGELVGISAERSAETVIGILGVLKMGGTYVPLDPTFPEERLNFILNDTGLSSVLTLERFSQKFRNQCSNVICLDAESNLFAEKSSENLPNNTSSSHPAYVIYTSGSTGKPKGVLISNQSLVNHSKSIAKIYQLQANDRILQFASFNFDVAAEELFPSLLSGATVILLPEQVRASLKHFTNFLVQENITVVNLPVSYWRQWTSVLAHSAISLPDTIRLCVTGSERVLPEDYNLWRKTVGSQVRWLNAYGLTETTITSLVFDPARSEMNEGLSVVPVGRPIHNTKVYLLDENLQPVPEGISGHLYIGGDCLALGYLNRPELTTEKFIPDPFDSTEQTKIYRTGDLARYLPNGEIEYLDRIDHQVKIRGFRVELGEIESVLGSHPRLREAVVVTRENQLGEVSLIAYVVPPDEYGTSKQPTIELWPSVGEYPVYDDLMYYSMSTDNPRTSRYEHAIKQLVKDKTVIEIGTGRDVILARFCIAAGAKKVYAIEALDDAYNGAKALVESLKLSEKIILIKGFSFDVELPEKVDVCVSEIIGTIGSSEGAPAILNDAWRFLNENGSMIPERSVTKIAAVQMPDYFLESPHFSELSTIYAKKVFQSVGYEFDVRVCLKNFPNESILSDAGIFEDLDFTGKVEPEYVNEIELTVVKSGRMDGFLLWLNLHTMEDAVIDSLEEQTSWLPVYFPIFEPGIEINPGDIIKATCKASLCENGFNPNYHIKGALHKQNGEITEFAFDSMHRAPVLKQTPFYQKLFSNYKIASQKLKATDASATGLRNYLSEFLPAYMIPSVFVELDELPLTPSGKVDRKALPAPAYNESERKVVTHKDDFEAKLVEIWERVLEFRPISITDDFFELGGHSLQAVRMFAELEETFEKNIPLATLFEANTIEKLADILRQEGWTAPESSIVPIQTEGAKPPFFCIHAKGGNVLFYRDLAKYMGTDRPFYGIQARRLGGRQVGHGTVEEMAEFYIKEIQSVQPNGPYYLGGSSFGGLAAFEMACQLRAQGQGVALLALLDTGTPDYPKLLPTTSVFRAKIYDYVRRAQHHYDSLKAFNTKEKADYILEKLSKIKLRYRRKIVNTYKKAARKFYLEVKKSNSLPQNYIQIEDQIAKAGENYVPKIYKGKMTLFRASNQPLGIHPDPTLGWENYVAGEIEIHEIPGHHGSIVKEPYVRTLAEKLNMCLDSAQLDQATEKAKMAESEASDLIRTASV